MELESHQGQQCQTNNLGLNNVNNGRSSKLSGYYYWGIYRKPAVKTSFRAQNTTPIKKNSSNRAGYSGVVNADKVFDEMSDRDEFKEKMISPKVGTFEGRSELGLLGNREKNKFLSGCNGAHQLFDKLSQRDEFKEKMISPKIYTFQGKSQVGLLGNGEKSKTLSGYNAHQLQKNTISTKIGTFGGKSEVALLRNGERKKLSIECNESEYEWGLLETLEREKKKKLLGLYKSLCEVLIEEGDKDIMTRVDQEAWKVLNGSGKVPKYHHIIGPVLGVDVGDEFDSMVELVVVGLHYHLVNGISYTTRPNSQALACSVVLIEGDCDVTVKANELTYTVEGGEFEPKDAKNQEMKRGNLALKNSIREQNFVRVVRGIITKVGSKTKTKFVYDGLYKVVMCYNDVGPNGKLVFKFVLKRCLGQKVIEWGKYRLVPVEC